MNRIYLLREKLHMTQDEFAEYCGIAKISIARYEGGAKVSSANAGKIAKACGVSIDYVLGEETEPDEEDEADRIRERLRRDPSFRILFSAAENVKPEHLEAAARMLQALGGNDD